jgi:aminoglycoside phosphotransferase (APT) family kinase protein
MESSDTIEPPADARVGAPGDVADMPALVAFINAQHGTRFRLTDRLLHGHRNVAGLYNASNTRFIIKWSPSDGDDERLDEAVRLVDRLRSRWYPVPRYVMRGTHAGGRYFVQTALPGSPVTRLTPSQVVQIVALNELQREQAAAPAEPWPARVADDVLEGGAGYCLLDPMRGHAPTTARVLDLLQELVAQHRGVSTPTTDIVHFDFQQSNMLGISGKISGVVDWEGALPGDRAFDLVTLLFYDYDQETVREMLWQTVTRLTDPAAVAVYLAHLIHRQVDWSIRHHEQPTLDRWLERARLVWEAIPQRTGCAVSPWP